MLSSFNFINKVYSAYDGRQAIQILKDGCEGRVKLPEVVMMDLHMPNMNGFELLKQIHDMECLRNEKIITVMFSSTLDPRDMQQAIGLGVDYFFSKPMAIEKLQSVFNEMF